MLYLLSDGAQDSSRHAIDSVKQVARTLVEDVTTTRGISKLQDLMGQLADWGLLVGMRIVAALVIFIIGRYVIRGINLFVKRLLQARDIDPGVKSFLESMVNVLLTVLLGVAVISKLGIETTSFAALLASFGVAVGMALSGNLQNFAGGLLILIFRPYRVGDYIETQGEEGFVVSIQIFHTVVRTYKGTNIYLPNGQMSNTMIKNFTKEPARMAEWIIGIDYGEQVERAEKAIRNALMEEKRIRKSPAIYIAVCNLGESSVNITVRGWVKQEDYFSTLHDGYRRIYEAFNREGINFPYPQMTIHQK